MPLVNVMVNSRAYTIACDEGEEEHLKELGAEVDHKVQELLGSVGQVGDQRLILMSALLLVLSWQGLFSTRLSLPFFKLILPDLSWGYILFAVLVLAGSANAVNLTDGLDGLAISVFAVSAAAFTALAYVSTHVVFSNYLQLVRLPPLAAELTIFCGALVGASLGFLWWNCYPAEIFMGDVGSLGLGGALGTVALLIKQEILFVVVGGVFVMEAASVIIQVASFKTTGRRVFKMAPLHHHFELLGWSETQVVQRFWLVGLLAAMIGVALALL